MQRYRVTLKDGRQLHVNADNLTQVQTQVAHQEATRIEIGKTRKVIAGERDRITALIEQYGEPLALQLLKTLHGPSYRFPDFSKPEASLAEQTPISTPVQIVVVDKRGTLLSGNLLAVAKVRRKAPAKKKAARPRLVKPVRAKAVKRKRAA